jgi:protein TonB
MKSACMLALASVLLAFHGPAAANTADSTELASETASTKKKAAKKTKVAVARKSVSRKSPPKEDAASIAASMALYKAAVARKISDAGSTQVYDMQPQALLRSVVVVRMVIDKNGKLISSVIQRSNRDPVTEAAALASLRKAAPLPKPPAALLTKGRLELMETWLFNDDGRFQIRSIAQAQKSE